jgi:hypothetical protein
MGVDVFGASTNGTNLYTHGTGTSSAAPLAGGITALLLSTYPYLTNEQVRSIFHESSDNSENPDNDRGYGLLSAVKAISFPNLQNLNGSYILNKAFLDSFTVNDVQLHYSTDRVNFKVLNMSAQIGYDYKFQSQFPSFSLNQVVDFYFTFTDENGNSHRDPENKNYKLLYGNLFVSLNLPLTVPGDYVLSNNYPNPFNSYTTINFIANGNYPAELTIYDAIGNKVKTLYKGISDIGINHRTWDGRTNEGLEAASGIYIYTLNLNGKFYAGKMVYLK